MLALRRALSPPTRGRPAAAVALRGLGSPVLATNKVAGIRSFASGPNRAASKKPGSWRTPGLLALGVVTYLVYEESKKEETLLMRILNGMMMNKRTKEHKEVFESIEKNKDVPMFHEAIFLGVFVHGMWYELCGENALALSHYKVASKFVKYLNPITARCYTGVQLLDRMAMVYRRTKQFDEAEKAFNKAIRAYEKFQAQHSPPEPSKAEAMALEKLDLAVLNVFLHYSMLKKAMDQAEEIPLLRERALELVRSSVGLRNKENVVMDQFDKGVATITIPRFSTREGGPEGKDANL